MKYKKIVILNLLFSLLILLSACGSSGNSNPVSVIQEQKVSETDQEGENQEMLCLKIDNTNISVDWEDNESIKALKQLCQNKPLSINMHKYGGFEQVGPIGSTIPSNDNYITTESGDIMLYSSNQIVVSYGPNSWSYTRLGKISDKTNGELKELLDNSNVTITLSLVK